MLRALAEVVFPAVCPGCGGRGEPLCPACARTVRRAPPPPPVAGIDALVVPFAYTGVVRELVARAKYRHRHAALAWLADAMTAELAVSPTVVDVVTWAPTTAARRRSRGFDQAEVLATAVATATARSCRAVLRRVGDRHQTGHSRAERLDAPGFAIRGSGAVAGRRVLLVDDVVTTGATLAACVTALRGSGSQHITPIVYARTPGR
jgi:ComF family protein